MSKTNEGTVPIPAASGRYLAAIDALASAIDAHSSDPEWMSSQEFKDLNIELERANVESFTAFIENLIKAKLSGIGFNAERAAALIPDAERSIAASIKNLKALGVEA